VRTFYCDLHIHIGRAGEQPVKITAARDLTFANIARECATRKGIDLAGIVDCASPAVLAEIRGLIKSGEMTEIPGGGLRYRDQVTVVLGSELETQEPGGGLSHHVSYFPTVGQLGEFSARLSKHVSNMQLSSQQCHLPAQRLFEITDALGGVFLPAHAFTPHKSVYGSCARRLSEMFEPDALARVPAIELGLSADSYLADRLAELSEKTFLSNSDAHSLPKIGREYNTIEMETPSFSELAMALRRENGRRVSRNFGLDPRLGKYHRTYCARCDRIEQAPPPVFRCPQCGGDEVVKGVLDRIVEIQDQEAPRPPEHRPVYQYQVPLQFVPKIGPVSLNKLLNRFGSEMTVLHAAAFDDLRAVVGTDLARKIVAARAGTLPLLPGGGGRYGKAAADLGETQLDLALDSP
jgi:uncharacterized protein (TIGR00375 family)